MKISIIAVGKNMPGWVLEGYQEYAKRFTRDYSIRLREVLAGHRTKGTDLARVCASEGEQLLAAVPQNDVVIALTERGQLWDSVTFAQRLQKWQDAGMNISFLIGGPEGLSPACLSAAHCQWSLSPLTFPHPLVRVVLIEQLYRAVSILQRRPYHK